MQSITTEHKWLVFERSHCKASFVWGVLLLWLLLLFLVVVWWCFFYKEMVKKINKSFFETYFVSFSL